MGIERHPKGFVFAEGLEIGIAPGQQAILRIESDGALQVCDRFRMLAALRVSDRQRVQRVVVIRVFVANEAQVRDGLVVPATVDRERRGVQTLFHRLWSCFTRSRVPLADVQIQAHAFVELLFLGIQPQYRFEQCGGGVIVVPLQCFQSALVQGNGFEIGRTPWWGCWRRGRSGRRE